MKRLAPPQAVFELGVPVLGHLLRMQTMASQLGGKVENAAKHEFGYAEIRAPWGTQALFRDIQDTGHRARAWFAGRLDEPWRQSD